MSGQGWTVNSLLSRAAQSASCTWVDVWHVLCFSPAGHQLRYSSDASDDDSDATDVCCSRSDRRSRWKQQQQQPVGALASRAVHVDQPLQQQDRNNKQQQQQSGPASELIQYACSTAGSEDDVCQWQSPIACKTRHQKRVGSVLQDVQNGPLPSSGGAVNQSNQSVKPGTKEHHLQDSRHTNSVEAVTLHALLDKVGQ